MLDRFFQRLWYAKRTHWFAVLLLPLSWLFGAVTALRRSAYRAGVFRSFRVARPVVVIGNITVGGVGKTPLTIWLAALLEARGVRVGILLRGYGGGSTHWPRDVTPDSSPGEVGDEAVLLAQRTQSIVVAGPDRVADAERAIERGAQLLLSDDGLQHYRLQRDIEIAVLDAQRGLGNGWLLPAGPLREPRRRLSTVDLIVLTHRSESSSIDAAGALSPTVSAHARLGDAISLATGDVQSLERFRGVRVHAIAAIGHPEAFFGALRSHGLIVDAHALPDHAELTSAHIQFDDDAPVLMTEKDAVKCRHGSDSRLWSVRMHIDMSESDTAAVTDLIGRLLATA